MKWSQEFKRVTRKQKITGVLIFVGSFLFYRSCIQGESVRLISQAYKNKSQHPEIKIFDGELEPEIPERWKSYTSLLGVDSNKNGIRDDVEIWINHMHDDPDIRNALRQYNKISQQILIIDDKSIEESNKYFQMESDAGSCLSGLIKDTDEYVKKSREIHMVQMNTFQRQQAYARARNKVSIPLGGPVYSSAENIKAYCRFRVVNHKE